MLAHPLEPEDQARLALEDFAVEWKWDGARVQVLRTAAGAVRIYTRTGEDITGGFPDLAAELQFEGVIDGELLIRAADGTVAPFNALQQRLNRKTVDAKLMALHPAFVRAYDLLVDGTTDLRGQPLRARRGRLQQLVARAGGPRLDLSPLVEGGSDWAALEALRATPTEPTVEGLMLKHWDSVYEAGRPKGPWWKWKRQPYTADCVLMYAQRGHGKRSSYYSDFTFGVWRGDALTPVGKAYFGFTDAELKQLDAFIRSNTIDRFGPVRAVTPTLVLEIAFDGLQRSTRHKSGLAMRFPRIARIRTDKPAAEADRIETLEALLPG
jgi:DNA ligase-1